MCHISIGLMVQAMYRFFSNPWFDIYYLFLKIQYFESDFIGNTHKPFTAELKRVANSVKTGKE